MRMLVLAALLCTGCSCKPESGLSGQATNAVKSSQTGTVQLEFYKRRVAKNGEVLTPPVLLRLSGTLAERSGCLVLTNGDGDHLLVFEEGKAVFDPIARVLMAGSARIAVGEPISVGGPFNQPDESFEPSTLKKRCGVNTVWLVSGTDVKSHP